MKRRAHYVLSSHWDREWYRPLQHFRSALVTLLDEVLDALATGRLHGPFTTDGQAIMLEDYLEVRPERRAEVEALARAGLLVVGPWYTVPDEFLVSGEALVRNLRYGCEVARRFGAVPSSAGWVCDQFGHISQLPQIFAGFGLRGVFLWRGVNFAAGRHFHWCGADGTVLPTYRFGRGGYSAFAFEVRAADDPGRRVGAAEARARLAAYLDAEAEVTSVAPLLVFDGGDHLAWDATVYEAVTAYSQDAGAPFALIHASLDAYLDDLLADPSAITATISGELREPGLPPRAENEAWLIPGVLASRVPLKQENAACETLLTRWAEPFSVWAALALGRPYPHQLLEIAWRWLLQNHPHDSLGGCSIDLVHRDMHYRFSQCRQIADLLASEATSALALAVAGDVAAHEMRVVVFNSLAQPLSETIELTLDLPCTWPTFTEFFGFEDLPAFRIYDPAGNEVPYQRLSQRLGVTRTRLDPHKFPQGVQVHEVRVSLPLVLPALGYVSLTVRPGALDPLLPHQSPRPIAQPTRHPGRGLATSDRTMANELLEVAIAPDGTLRLHDRRNGATYEHLLSFEDCADIGDGWFHGLAVADAAHSSCGAATSVALVHNGPYLTTFRLRTALRVPERFDFVRGTRAETLTTLELDTLVSLRPGCARVEVATKVRNTAFDHRLRVLLPSGTDAATYLADGAFDVLERPVALRADAHTYRELEVEGRPQLNWSAVYAAGRGLAVVAPGQLETAVLDRPDRSLALTLYRSTGRTVLTDGEPDGQLLGEQLAVRYWLVPLNAAPDRAALGALAQQVAAGLRTSQCAAGDRPVMQPTQRLPLSASLLRLSGGAVLSSLAQTALGLEVRIFNPEEAAITATLHVPTTIRQAQRVNLAGEPLEAPLPVREGVFDVVMGAKQIVSLRLAG
ncbi:glycoside hydrolase [Candidatus Chloroploca sp. M-50]|uniref:Glycoside hydrolase n=1 Tax=Candidatus Chloroploca mongolica TaxID=2528176 RepID=A0ABS4D502_9CHLR|nr:glycoside hydrolase family 38 C-terminal domain-containing protein [Candidatus Chloroploca mongolica]MBP1464515.1 glycoside hydrolase [Candidatus Chloroploca mongolica]